jgi:hypothetical protein
MSNADDNAMISRDGGGEGTSTDLSGYATKDYVNDVLNVLPITVTTTKALNVTTELTVQSNNVATENYVENTVGTLLLTDEKALTLATDDGDETTLTDYIKSLSISKDDLLTATFLVTVDDVVQQLTILQIIALLSKNEILTLTFPFTVDDEEEEQLTILDLIESRATESYVDTSLKSLLSATTTFTDPSGGTNEITLATFITGIIEGSNSGDSEGVKFPIERTEGIYDSKMNMEAQKIQLESVQANGSPSPIRKHSLSISATGVNVESEVQGIERFIRLAPTSQYSQVMIKNYLIHLIQSTLDGNSTFYIDYTKKSRIQWLWAGPSPRITLFETFVDGSGHGVLETNTVIAQNITFQGGDLNELLNGLKNRIAPIEEFERRISTTENEIEALNGEVHALMNLLPDPNRPPENVTITHKTEVTEPQLGRFCETTGGIFNTKISHTDCICKVQLAGNLNRNIVGIICSNDSFASHGDVLVHCDDGQFTVGDILAPTSTGARVATEEEKLFMMLNAIPRAKITSVITGIPNTVACFLF